MPKGKGQKRKREEEEDTEPLRRSSRQRKRTSYGEDFVEVWSPPKGNGKDSQPSTSTGITAEEPDPPADSVTWPSDVDHYGKELPSNHRKRLYFFRKRQPINGQRSS